MHFVQQLFRHRCAVYQPAGSVGLGDRKCPVFADFGDGETCPGQIGHVLETGIGKVTARHLPAAFQKMARNSSLCQTIKFVWAPAEFVDQRAQRQGTVGCPPDQNDVCPGCNRLGNWSRAQVGICRNDRATIQTDAFHRVHGGNFACRDVVQQIIAGHSRNGDAVNAQFGGDLQHACRGTDGVRGPHVRNDRDPA